MSKVRKKHNVFESIAYCLLIMVITGFIVLGITLIQKVVISFMVGGEHIQAYVVDKDITEELDTYTVDGETHLMIKNHYNVYMISQDDEFTMDADIQYRYNKYNVGDTVTIFICNDRYFWSYTEFIVASVLGILFGLAVIILSPFGYKLLITELYKCGGKVITIIAVLCSTLIVIGNIASMFE